MNKLYSHRYLIRQNLVLLIGICLSFYFSYHAISGERSYTRLMSLNETIVSTKMAHAALNNEKNAFAQKVVMLRPGSLNRDLLEERARAVLGYQRKDEVAILAPRKS